MNKLIYKILNKQITQDIIFWLIILTFLAIFLLTMVIGAFTTLWIKLKVISVLGFKISNCF